MDNLVTTILILPLSVMLVLQGTLNHVENLRSVHIEQVIDRATELAAVEGYYTKENIDMIKEHLEKLNYNLNEVEITYTSNVALRGEVLFIKIIVPDDYTNIIPNTIFLINEELSRSFYSSRMSEKVL